MNDINPESFILQAWSGCPASPNCTLLCLYFKRPALILFLVPRYTLFLIFFIFILVFNRCGARWLSGSTPHLILPPSHNDNYDFFSILWTLFYSSPPGGAAGPRTGTEPWTLLLAGPLIKKTTIIIIHFIYIVPLQMLKDTLNTHIKIVIA